jgi:hypothetical protein
MALPKNVDKRELLTRYIVHRKWYRKPDRSIKGEAFEPRNLQTSVYRTIGLAKNEVRTIGEGVASASSKQLYGWTDLAVLKVYEISLGVDPDNNPHRHANIIYWPPEVERQKLLAKELAAEATTLISQ